MAITFPLQLSRDASVKQQPEGGELARSNAYRSLNAAIVAADLVHFDGDLWVPATDPGSIDGLAVRPIVVADDAPGIGQILTRGSEVSDAVVRYGDLDYDAVNERLRELGIIVRPAVLPPE